MEELIGGLDEIRSALPDAYAGYADDEDEDSYVEAGQIESAEVEVGISSVISTMTDRCRLSKEPDSLAELFEKIFSPDDELVDLAVNLEDAVNGYFGELFGEDLDLANDYLRDIIRVLETRRDAWKKMRSDSQNKSKPE